MSKYAALFVDPAGVYARDDRAEVWGLPQRDARYYSGPWPVVAHPPCNRWIALGAANYARWGGEHNRPGNDGGCFESALNCVRRFGGVLEHPGGSQAFAAFGLRRPTGAWIADGEGGWVCQVWQSHYGHLAAKRTWLYCVSRYMPPPLTWGSMRGICQIGFPDRRGKKANKPTLSGALASATPEPFAHVLAQIALGSGV